MRISTISWIKRHISKMPEGRMFHTSELLSYGPRGTVDQNLRRLWKKGFIVKVARAVWVKAVNFQPAKTPLPSIMEIARLKAGAFKKEIISGIKQITDWSFQFLSNGRNSSFQSCHGRIYLRQTCMRKISLGDGIVGATLLKIWNAGPIMLDDYMEALEKLRRTERQELRRLTSSVPQWLRSALHWEHPT